MYIIETFRGTIRIDADELVKLRDEQDKKLIFFRQGAVNPNQIVRVIADTERKEEIPKLSHESEADHQARIEAERSEDIFETIRSIQPQLQNGTKRLLP